MRAIAAHGIFVSRGDESGTHTQELALWAAARIEPRALTRREETGQGMGATLNIADQKRAYTLTDRGTYLVASEATRARRSVSGRPGAAQHLPRLRREYGQASARPGAWRRGRSSTSWSRHRFSRRSRAFKRDVYGEPLFVPDAHTGPGGPIESLTVTGLFGPDAAMPAIVLRTLFVSGAAAAMAVLVGVPAGYVIARRSFRGRTLLLGLVNTGMGMPPVVVGLVVWVMLVRSGPFGDLGLIYTQSAMVVAQFLIATPIVIGFTAASIQALSPQLPDLLVVLGAGRVRTLWLLAGEARLGTAGRDHGGIRRHRLRSGRLYDRRRQPRAKHARADDGDRDGNESW